MSLKIKKRKLWILNTTILTIGVAIVPIAVNCGNDVKIIEISVASLQNRATLENGRWSGNQRIRGTMHAYVPAAGIFGNVDVKYHLGDSTDTIGIEIGNLVNKGFSNGNFVWIKLVAKSGYVWPKAVNVIAKGWTRVDDTKIQIKLTVKDLKEAISVASLQDKVALETGRWSGKQGVRGTMRAYVPTVGIFGNVDVKYHLGDSTDVIGIEIANLVHKGFNNGKFVWIKLVANDSHVWPKAVNVTAKGWIRVDDTTIQIKLTIKDLKEVISVANLQVKETIETRRWSGTQKVVGTMVVYVPPVGISGNVDVEYYQGDDTNTIGDEIVDLRDIGFNNGDFVWIRLAAKPGYVWPRAAVITRKGWTYVDDTIIQIKLTVRDLR